MITALFLEALEQKLTEELAAVSLSYWCDGVLEPEWESDYLPQHIAQTKEVVLRAWIDKGFTDGRKSSQQLYKLVVELGPDSLAAYLQDEDLTDYLAGRTKTTPVSIDANLLQIHLFLT